MHIFTDGIPYDGSAQEKLHPNHLALIITYSLLAVAGLMYAGVCLLFNTIFKSRKWVGSLDMQFTLSDDNVLQ